MFIILIKNIRRGFMRFHPRIVFEPALQRKDGGADSRLEPFRSVKCQSKPGEVMRP